MQVFYYAESFIGVEWSLYILHQLCQWCLNQEALLGRNRKVTWNLLMNKSDDTVVLINLYVYVFGTV